MATENVTPEGETYYCGVQTRGVRYVDPEPAEYCEVEVEHEDETCARHTDDGGPDDDFDHDTWLEEQRERAADNSYYDERGI